MSSHFQRAAQIVARIDRVPLAAILEARRRVDRRRRHLAAYLAHVGAGQPLKQVAREAGLAPSSLREAVGKLEDRRDDPAFDAWLGNLERRIAA